MSLLQKENIAPIPEHIRRISKMRMGNYRSLEIRKQVFIQNFNLFWEDIEVTKNILQDLGTEAWDWFIQSYKEQLIIKELDPTWEIMLAPYEYTKHDDGRVTLK